MLIPSLDYVAKEVEKLSGDDEPAFGHKLAISSPDRGDLKAAVMFASMQSKGLESLRQLAFKVFRPQNSSFKLKNLIKQALNWLRLPALQLDVREIEI